MFIIMNGNENTRSQSIYIIVRQCIIFLLLEKKVICENVDPGAFPLPSIYLTSALAAGVSPQASLEELTTLPDHNWIWEKGR